MLKLHVLQARFGDCLVLEYGTPDEPRAMLVDGGPSRTYKATLRPFLLELAARVPRLDAAMLSHVDDDHLVGLRDLLLELRGQRDLHQPPLIEIGELWHNSFTDSVGDASLEQQVRQTMNEAAQAAGVMTTLAATVQGIKGGHTVRTSALLLGIPLNPSFPDGRILVDDAPPVRYGNLSLRVVGPTRKNLDALRTKWLAWLESNREKIARGDEVQAVQADRSIPNLSSVVVLAEADGRRVLLTGDARSDHILQGLEQTGLLPAGGTLHVDVLKMPHHGSSRNLDADFVRAVTADTYVISADGTHGNPDDACLELLVTGIRDTGRHARIVLTNATDSTARIVASCPPEQYGYTLEFLPAGQPFLTIALA